ncbi:putative FMN-dependent luciferase-like monooxygenase [Georgenia soli]|uniref:Putative FMN-dependent luciferase-like monooxygenase n=1 Tax=Georgenia soli TaxID=638953 RepID=A0A2A9ERI9_9MICO|nr:putative FMN-dependent luciferase-like monooxygenase [Georgenia soli]PFG40880.1 putative FMN-dependent luciferase-like monooxygenase [Georgenia soli]
MTTRLGIFTRVLDYAPPAERYRNAVEQVQLAERLGFDAAWVAQHHFDGDEGGLPSPLVLLSHLAAVTERIRLGTAIITLPLENPVRVAEDASVLDVLSGGRLELGLGSGGTPKSFSAFGLDVADKHAVHAAHLDVLRGALAGGDLGHPHNQLYPPAPGLAQRLWQATFSAAGAERAGAAGDGLMLSRTQPRPAGAPDASLSEIQHPVIDAYLAALPTGVEPRILASRTLFVTEDRQRARVLAGAGLFRAVEKLRAIRHDLPIDDLDTVIRRTDSYVGTPDEVVELLRQDTALARATDVSFQVHSIDPPHEDVLRSVELIATEVAPALGWATRGPSAEIDPSAGAAPHAAAAPLATTASHSDASPFPGSAARADAAPLVSTAL